MKILVGSKNPTKINATKETFSLYFDEEIEVQGISVNSDVEYQPINDQTFDGAKNRALALKEQNPKADFFVGIEGGMIELNNKPFNTNIACVIDSEGSIGFGMSPTYQLADSIAQKLKQGTELGQIMDEITGEEKTKIKGGAIDYFSQEKIDRTEMTKLALIMALVPINNKKLY